jgi:ssDNA-binding Zn-finger/Zn-ribbon topoisomerase 1
MAKCPKCGKPFKVVAYGRDYKILGCPEHREFDRIICFETRQEAEGVEP